MYKPWKLYKVVPSICEIFLLCESYAQLLQFFCHCTYLNYFCVGVSLLKFPSFPAKIFRNLENFLKLYVQITKFSTYAKVIRNYAKFYLNYFLSGCAFCLNLSHLLEDWSGRRRCFGWRSSWWSRGLSDELNAGLLEWLRVRNRFIQASIF